MSQKRGRRALTQCAAPSCSFGNRVTDTVLSDTLVDQLTDGGDEEPVRGRGEALAQRREEETADSALQCSIRASGLRAKEHGF